MSDGTIYTVIVVVISLLVLWVYMYVNRKAKERILDSFPGKPELRSRQADFKRKK